MKKFLLMLMCFMSIGCVAFADTFDCGACGENKDYEASYAFDSAEQEAEAIQNAIDRAAFDELCSRGFYSENGEHVAVIN